MRRRRRRRGQSSSIASRACVSGKRETAATSRFCARGCVSFARESRTSAMLARPALRRGGIVAPERRKQRFSPSLVVACLSAVAVGRWVGRGRPVRSFRKRAAVEPGATFTGSMMPPGQGSPAVSGPQTLTLFINYFRQFLATGTRESRNLFRTSFRRAIISRSGLAERASPEIYGCTQDAPLAKTMIAAALRFAFRNIQISRGGRTPRIRDQQCLPGCVRACQSLGAREGWGEGDRKPIWSSSFGAIFFLLMSPFAAAALLLRYYSPEDRGNKWMPDMKNSIEVARLHV